MCVFQNPKWQKANHLAIYKHGGTVELRTVERQIQTTVKACLERVPCTHPATFSLLANFITLAHWQEVKYQFYIFVKMQMLHPVLTPKRFRKKFKQQISRPWSFLRAPTIEANMNSSSLLPLTFPYTFRPYKPCQSSRNKILSSFWCILRQVWFRWLGSNAEHGHCWFEVTQRRSSRQHFHNCTTYTPL